MLVTSLSRLVSADPPPIVKVEEAKVRNVVETADFLGRIVPLESVEIRASIRAPLLRIHFKPGQMVKAGDILFELEPTSLRLDLELAEAQLRIEQAQAKVSELELARLRALFERQAISQPELDMAQAQTALADARLRKAVASRKKAEFGLSQTQIRAPRSGKIGRSLVQVGNVVNAGDPADLLTIIVSTDPVFVEFDVRQELFRKLRKGHWNDAPGAIPLRVSFAQEPGAHLEGRIDYLGTEVDPATGAVRVRGILANRPEELLIGSSVQVRVPVDLPRDVLLVPQMSVGFEEGKRFVYIVNKKNIVEQRLVRIGSSFDARIEIKEGLVAGESVVIRKGGPSILKGLEVQPVTVSDQR